MLMLGPHPERAIMTDFLYTACRINAILALDEPVAQVYQVNTVILWHSCKELSNMQRCLLVHGCCQCSKFRCWLELILDILQARTIYVQHVS